MVQGRELRGVKEGKEVEEGGGEKGGGGRGEESSGGWREVDE